MRPPPATYVLGTIIESNGEDVEIRVDVTDISGNHWFTRTFDHTVESGFHKDARNTGKDPYDPVFDEAANRVALELEDYESKTLADLKDLTELRFGAHLNDDAFGRYFTVSDGRAEMTAFPSEDDPMLRRTRAIRVRDQLFVDNLQETYRTFSAQMEASYLTWQEQSQLAIEAEREADAEATEQALLGVLGIGLAVLAAVAGANSDSAGASTAAMTGAAVAGVAGVSMLQESFQTSKEARVHRDALNELGESIDVDLAPQVIDFQKQTVELTGTAKEQFAQWRAFLKRIYAEERTPERQL